MILLILSPISSSPQTAAMSSKDPPGGISIRLSRVALYMTYFTKSSVRNVVLVLRGVHPPKFVATLPQRAVVV
jgi:hypothetical protein